MKKSQKNVKKNDEKTVIIILFFFCQLNQSHKSFPRSVNCLRSIVVELGDSKVCFPSSTPEGFLVRFFIIIKSLFFHSKL